MPQPCPVRTRRRRSTAADDDADLTRLLGGDERSFERLVERHHGSLRRIAAAHGVTGSAEERALLRTWSAFLELAASGEPVVSVRSVLATLLLKEIAVARPSVATGPASHA